MGFSAGIIGYRCFSVIGPSHALPDQAVLDRLQEHMIQPTETGRPEEIEYGWCGGRHVLDLAFDFEHNVYNDCLVFALRTDTHRVPGAMKKAYQLLEEQAVAAENPSGFISKQQKRQVKDSISQKLDEELRSGKYRRSRLTPILWDLPAGRLYSPVSSGVLPRLSECFERTFGLQLLPLSSGALALRQLESMGRRRDYEDARPTRFAPGPEGESQKAEYPWVAKGPEAKDFLGNEFVLWLWHQARTSEGYVTSAGQEVAVLLEKVLDLDCVFGQTGRDVLRGDSVLTMPEAADALRSGKVPRRAGLILNAARAQYAFTLAAESLGVSSLILPEVEEADTPRVLFEERITALRQFSGLLENLFQTFLKQRTGGSWEGTAQEIRRWIARGGKRPAAMATA